MTPSDPHRTRRQLVLFLAVLNALVLGTGVVAAADLRAQRTPGGVALRWVEAVLVGNCDDYLGLSVATAPETRLDSEVCRDLRAQAQHDAVQAGLRLTGVTQHHGDARADLVLTRPGKDAPLTVHLVRRGGRWRVLRDVITCNSVGCA